jgi:hypothetical protein
VGTGHEGGAKEKFGLGVSWGGGWEGEVQVARIPHFVPGT